MPTYTQTPTTLNQSRALFNDYRATIRDLNDDFWESHLIDANWWRVTHNDEPLALFAIHANENLTFFHTPPSALRHAQPIFRQLLETHAPNHAFVTTGDELFLALAIDCHTHIDKQAYFFVLGDAPVRAPEFDRALLRPATLADAPDILDTEGVEENIRAGKYYILRDKGGVFLGQGFYNPLDLTPNAVSIGMSVHPNHRLRGAGRSIIMHLAQIAREQGQTPCCGCWYYNHTRVLNCRDRSPNLQRGDCSRLKLRMHTEGLTNTEMPE